MKAIAQHSRLMAKDKSTKAILAQQNKKYLEYLVRYYQKRELEYDTSFTKNNTIAHGVKERGLAVLTVILQL
jgi:hypothetical protein